MRTLIGHFGVDSGQAMVGDPCYLEDWKPNDNDPWAPEQHAGEYGYQGACNATIGSLHGVIGEVREGEGKAVCFRTGYGDGAYPVYAEYCDDGKRVAKITIEFV